MLSLNNDTPLDHASLDMGPGRSGTQRTPVGTPMERPNAAAADAPTTIDVSTTFQPIMLVNNHLPDLILLSSDNVHFYVHRALVLPASHTAYGVLLALPPPPNDGSPPIVPIPEPAEVLNIVAHAIYRLPIAQFMPPFAAVSAAFDALARYGVPLAPLSLPGSPLHTLVLSQTPLRPIEAYALAAHHDLPALAAPISALLLAHPIPQLPDELAERIGPIYLKRLFLLHSGRTETLKDLLLRPPQGHEPTSDCDATQQERLTRAWALTSVRLAWDAQPNISADLLQAPLLHLEQELSLSCTICKRALRDCRAALVRDWASVKVTSSGSWFSHHPHAIALDHDLG